MGVRRGKTDSDGFSEAAAARSEGIRGPMVCWISGDLIEAAVIVIERSDIVGY
jgi:hypothetical protein